MKPHVVTITHKSFRSIEGKEFQPGHQVAIFQKCGAIPPRFPQPWFNAPIIFFEGCDKNFIYHWMKRFVFPKASLIYLNSHPCESVVFDRFRDGTRMYLAERFRAYKETWAWDNPNVIVMPTDEYYYNFYKWNEAREK
jgi:uncharacterized protein DUF5845